MILWESRVQIRIPLLFTRDFKKDDSSDPKHHLSIDKYEEKTNQLQANLNNIVFCIFCMCSDPHPPLRIRPEFNL